MKSAPFSRSAVRTFLGTAGFLVIAVGFSPMAFAQDAPPTPVKAVGDRISPYGADRLEPFRAEVARKRVATPVPGTVFVTVSGDAFSTGTYAFSDGKSALEAIVEVGGPGPTGSMREVEVVLADRTSVQLDLYPYLSRGDSRRDVRLSGRVDIRFRPAGRRVIASAGFKTPAEFELTQSEGILDLMEWAAGPRLLGQAQDVVVRTRRAGQGEFRQPIDQVLSNPKLVPTLTDGDRIEIVSSRTRAATAVRAYGFEYFAAARAAADRRINPERTPQPTAPVSPGNPANPATPEQAEFDRVNRASAMPLPALDRYQLGPGDVLDIRFWSDVLEPKQANVTVDASGQITVPDSGRRISVRGQTLAQVEVNVQRILARVIRNVKLSVSLRELRKISVTVMGDAYLPGSLILPSTATLFNAIVEAGGPSEVGSLRSIELKRTNGTTHRLDLYRFLIRGDAKQDTNLQPGDVIFFPPAGSRVTVAGEVRRPAIYELAPNELLRDALVYAGGLKPTGVAQRVALESVAPGQARQLIDVDLNDRTAKGNPPLYDGDVVEVQSLRPDINNEIRVEGAVDQPGRYAYKEGMKVADLIRAARGTREEASLVRADLFRRNPDQTFTLIPVNLEGANRLDPAANLTLKPNDRLVVYAQSDVQWMGDRRIDVVGAVQRPGQFYRADAMSVRDLLLQAGGLLTSAAADQLFLQRTKPDGTLGQLLILDAAKVVAGDSTQNVLLQDRDVLTVYTVQQAKFVPVQRVRVLGPVQTPGAFPRAENMRLRDLLALAGGPLPRASDRVEVVSGYRSATEPARVFSLKNILAGLESDNPRLSDGDLVTLSDDASFREQAVTVTILGAVKRPGPYAIQDSSERLSSVVERAGGLTASAFPKGTQFYRKPEFLRTDSQVRIAPRVLDVLRLVSDEEYKRAVAKADFEKIKLLGGNPSTTIQLPIGNAAGSTTTAPPSEAVAAIAQKSSVTPARSLVGEELLPAGNLFVDLASVLKGTNPGDDLALREGDIIIVPDQPTTVSVVGAVVLPSAIIFEPGRNVQYYLDRTGGFTLDAAKDRMIIIRTTGAVEKATPRTRVEVGDVILTPTRVMAERLTQRQTFLEEFTKQVTNVGFVYALIKAILK